MHLLVHPLCVVVLRTVHLVVHVEEGEKRGTVGEDEVQALKKLEKAWIVRRKLHELKEVDATDHVESSPHQV